MQIPIADPPFTCRRALFTTLSLVVTAGLGIGLADFGATTRADQGTPGLPTLKDTLEKGLKARLPEEFAFIAVVVRKVDRGDLPLSLVDSTFLWARKRDSHAFQYFEQAIRLRAQQIGVTL